MFINFVVLKKEMGIELFSLLKERFRVVRFGMLVGMLFVRLFFVSDKNVKFDEFLSVGGMVLKSVFVVRFNI